MSTSWRLDGPALRRARIAKKLTVAELAKKSGIGERTLRRYETGKHAVRVAYLEPIAKVLGIAVEDIARPPAAVHDARVPVPTPLETLVASELARAPLPPVSVEGKEYPRFTAKTLQDLFTAYAAHEGERFAIVGELRTQRGLSVDEGKLLGTRSGFGARFHLFVELARGETLGVTIHTRRAEDSTRLQAVLGKKVTLVVRVVVAPGEPADDAPGFQFFMSERQKPWALAVEVIG